MRTIRWITAAAFLIASSAQAALISVTADVGWSCATGTGGFEPGCIPDVERGMVNFVYNTSIPDSDPSSTNGAYSGAIVAFAMTIEQQSRPDLFFTLAPGANSMTTSFSSLGDKYVTMSLTASDQSGAYGNVGFLLRADIPRGAPPYDSIPLADAWSTAGARAGSAVGIANETDWGINFRAVTLVPTSNTLALLLAGAIALSACAVARRTVDSGCRQRH